MESPVDKVNRISHILKGKIRVTVLRKSAKEFQ